MVSMTRAAIKRISAFVYKGWWIGNWDDELLRNAILKHIQQQPLCSICVQVPAR